MNIETNNYEMKNDEEYEIYQKMDIEGGYQEFDKKEYLYYYNMVKEDDKESDEEESQLYLLDQKINQDIMMGSQDVKPPQGNSAGYIIGPNLLVSKEEYNDLDKEIVKEDNY